MTEPEQPKKDHWFRDLLAYGIFRQNAFLPVLGIAILSTMLLPALSKAKLKIQHAQCVLYCAQDQFFAEPVLREFEKETGIQVKAVFDSEAVKTVGLANRLLAEKGHPQCDVFWGNEELRTRQLAAQGVFRETNGWVAFGYRSRRVVINTNFVSERRSPNRHDSITPQPRAGSEIGAPTSLLELTNDRWRGKVALAYPLFGTTATHFLALRQHWGAERWETWCRALAANKPFLVDGNSVVVKLVGRGEAWIGLTDSDDIAASQREGRGLTALPLTEESLLIPNTAAVIRDAPHPANAQRLFEYLQRNELMEKLVRASALEGATVATETMTLKPDWDALLRELETGAKRLKEIFLR